MVSSIVVKLLHQKYVPFNHYYSEKSLQEDVRKFGTCFSASCQILLILVIIHFILDGYKSPCSELFFQVVISISLRYYILDFGRSRRDFYNAVL